MKRFSLTAAAFVFGVILVAALCPAAWAAWGTNDAAPSTVYDLLKQHKELSKFVDMISDAGIKSLFEDKSATITVLAPDNDAISDISRADMKKIEAGKDSLQSFVKYHVITGSRVSSSAMNQRKFSSAAANGETIAFDGTASPTKVNDGHIVASDLSVGTSVVHVISAALIPASFKEETKTPPASPPGPAAADSVSAPVVPVASSKPFATGAPIGSSVKTPIGSSAKAPVGSSAPLGTTVPVGSAVSINSSTPETPPTPAQSGGFTLFGHHFGGNGN